MGMNYDGKRKLIDMDANADEAIRWGVGRAVAITILPLPIADIGALAANEAYMIYRIAKAYGYDISESVVSMLVGIAGGSFSRRMLISLIPILKIPIAAGITYSMGKVAKAYFASGMTLSQEAIRNEFVRARQKAATIDWSSTETIDI